MFNASEADKAFRYMTTGKHIGKMVIKIREEEDFREPVTDIKPAQEMTVTTKTSFFQSKQSVHNYSRIRWYGFRAQSLDDIIGSDKIFIDLKEWH